MEKTLFGGDADDNLKAGSQPPPGGSFTNKYAPLVQFTNALANAANDEHKLRHHSATSEEMTAKGNQLPSAIRMNVLSDTSTDGMKANANDVSLNSTATLTDYEEKLQQYLEESDVQTVNVQDVDGDTLLHLLIAAEKVDASILVIKKLAHDHLNVKNAMGQAPLHLAVVTGQLKIISALGQYGADFSVTDGCGNSAVHLASDCNNIGALSKLFEACPKACRSAFLASLSSINHKGQGAIHIATLNRNPNILAYLIEKGTNVDMQEERGGKTSLVLALETNNWSMALELINQHADVNKPTFSGNTPLHYALSEDQVDIVQSLVSNGCDIALTNIHGESPNEFTKNEQMREVLSQLKRQGKKRKQYRPDYE